MQNIIILTQRIENKKRYHFMEDTTIENNSLFRPKAGWQKKVNTLSYIKFSC